MVAPERAAPPRYEKALVPLPFEPPLEPMLAKLVRTLPEGAFVYEPKWDGFRALVFREGDEVDIRSRNDRPLARYFPEVVEVLRALEPGSFVIDGEIVVAGEVGLDFGALMTRLHPAASRVEELRRAQPATFVAFDLLAVGAEDIRHERFAARRARLEELVGKAPPAGLVLTPSTSDKAVAAEWLARFRSRGIDGVMAKAPDLPYSAGKRTMVKVKHERTADVVVAGIRLTGKRGEPPAVGSVLLGLHDASDRLVHIGVVSQLTKERRLELARELAPFIVPLEGHPWERGFGLERSPLGRLAGSAGRWSPEEMERDWIPVSPTRVCEIAYDTIDEHRLRYPARFVRWRPDRDPASCGFDQLEGAPGDVRVFLAS